MKHFSLFIVLLLQGSLPAQNPSVEPDTRTEEGKTNSLPASNALTDSQATTEGMQGAALVDGETVQLSPIGPLFTFVDPVRDISNGTVWVWSTDRGRPAAIMSLCDMKGRKYHEFHSFSDHPLAFEILHNSWRPPSAWKATEISTAPAPHASPTRRLLQMKQLLERFGCTEKDNRTGKTYSMRILPQPIFRYAKSTQENDGAVFIIVRDGDPEAELLIETKPKKDGTVGWQFMAGTMTIHQVTVFLDDQPFPVPGERGTNHPYFYVTTTPTAKEQ